MIKHLFTFLKSAPFIFGSLLLSSCDKESEVINYTPEIVDEQLESDFFDCQENNDIDIVVIEDGTQISPYLHNEMIHLNLNQSTHLNYINQLNNELVQLNKPQIDFAVSDVYAMHYYFTVQNTNGVQQSKVCYSPQDNSLELKVYLESTVGGSGMVTITENFYVIVPKSFNVNQVSAIIKNRMCESAPFVVDCEIETTTSSL